MRRYMKPKIISCLIMLSFIISSFSGYSVTYAENSTGEKGNPVTITDPVTGCTYNYVNFNGKTLVHPYQGKDAWTNDGKMFLCGVNDIDAHHGTIYLYDTENNEFIKVGSGVVSTEVCGVIGTDDCVYYSTGTALRKYDIKTKKTTVIIPADLGFYPTSLTISNDCNYIYFYRTTIIIICGTMKTNLQYIDIILQRLRLNILFIHLTILLTMGIII